LKEFNISIVKFDSYLTNIDVSLIRNTKKYKKEKIQYWEYK